MPSAAYFNPVLDLAEKIKWLRQDPAVLGLFGHW